MNASEIRVDIEGDVIVASLPGTSYRALFFLSPNKRKLIQAEQLSVDKKAPLYHEEFEAKAWEAANAKARELGWIVTGLPPD